MPVLYRWSGTAWEAVGASTTTPAFANYVPTNTGVTVGDGTQVARWFQVGTGAGSLVVVRYSITFGTTTAFSATTAFGLPVAANGVGGAGGVSGGGYALNSGVQEYSGVTRLAVGGSSSIQVLKESNGAAWSNTVPFSFAVGDVLSFTVTYEAAA